MTDEANQAKHTVFDVGVGSLSKLNIVRHKQQTTPSWVISKHDSTLRKFCDVCKRINLDPMHTEALPLVIIFMSKSKHCAAIVEAYASCHDCGDVLALLDVKSADVQKHCETLLSSMSDWLILLQHLQVHPAQHAALVHADSNPIMQRMQSALREANFCAVPSKSLTQLQLSLLALLYTSPRCTPAGKMLENLYTEVSEHGPDAELRCLRAMAKFKDTVDDEDAYAQMFLLLMRCFAVHEGFKRSVESVVRQRKQELDEARDRQNASKSVRPLLRVYAEKAVQQQQRVLSQQSWQEWRNQIQFPVTTSSHLQRLLYFICTQTERADETAYAKWYDASLLSRAREIAVDHIDVHALLAVIDSVRLYSSNIKHLIDFRAKCLHGLNAKARQELHLSRVLQLYIACFQHESVWEQCWKHVLPVMNHTISSACRDFRTRYPYEVTEVVHNLGRCMLQE
jgi:hypothetical protein